MTQSQNHHAKTNLRNSQKSNWLSEGPFVFFDLETTGMSPAKDRIIEIGAIRCEKDGSEKNFSSLINPEIKISNYSSRIHYINEDMLHNAPKFRQIAEIFMEFCRHSTLVAHNALFDLAFLQESLKRENLPLWNGKCIDSIALIKRLYPNLSSYSLPFLKEYFAIKSDEASHRALSDAKLLKEIFHMAVENSFKPSPL